MQTVRKKVRELSERFLAARPASVEIIAPSCIASGEQGLVLLNFAGKSACDRPDGPGVEDAEQHRMRHETGNAPISVEEGMHPEQAMVGRSDREQAVQLAETAIDFGKPGEEARQRSGTGRDVLTDLHVALSQFAGDNPHAFARGSVLDP